MSVINICEENNKHINKAFDLLKMISEIENTKAFPCCEVKEVKAFLKRRNEFIDSLNIG